MKKTKPMLTAAVLALALCVAAGCGKSEKDNGGKQTADAEIILVLSDKTEVKYDISVKKGLTIREALYEAYLIDDENRTSPLVTTIDGHTADAEKDGAEWVPCDESGKELSGGDSGAECALDGYTVEDGKTYRLVYTVKRG